MQQSLKKDIKSQRTDGVAKRCIPSPGTEHKEMALRKRGSLGRPMEMSKMSATNASHASSAKKFGVRAKTPNSAAGLSSKMLNEPSLSKLSKSKARRGIEVMRLERSLRKDTGLQTSGDKSTGSDHHGDQEDRFQQEVEHEKLVMEAAAPALKAPSNDSFSNGSPEPSPRAHSNVQMDRESGTEQEPAVRQLDLNAGMFYPEEECCDLGEDELDDEGVEDAVKTRLDFDIMPDKQ